MSLLLTEFALSLRPMNGSKVQSRKQQSHSISSLCRVYIGKVGIWPTGSSNNIVHLIFNVAISIQFQNRVYVDIIQEELGRVWLPQSRMSYRCGVSSSTVAETTRPRMSSASQATLAVLSGEPIFISGRTGA